VVGLKRAYELYKGYKDDLRIYPGSMKLSDDGKNYAIGSRTVASVGIAESIEEAREISLKGIRAITGGALWYRNDIASGEHIDRSKENMKKIRTK
jgi:phosphoribosylamine-glycine ligase